MDITLAMKKIGLNFLVSASRASRGVTLLGVCVTFFSFSAFGLHDGEVYIGTHGILVSALTGVETTGIRGVSFECLEGVEVGGRAGGTGVPLFVDLLLGIIVPKFFVVFSVFKEQFGGNTDLSGRSKGRSGGGKAKNKSSFKLRGQKNLELSNKHQIVRRLSVEFNYPNNHFYSMHLLTMVTETIFFN